MRSATARGACICSWSSPPPASLRSFHRTATSRSRTGCAVKISTAPGTVTTRVHAIDRPRGATMAAKRKSVLRSINPSGIPTLRDDLKPELAPIAIALTEELAALLATVLDDGRKQTLDRLSQALSDAVPELLQRAFEQELLAGGKPASERRASLVAVLRASEVPVHITSARQTPAADESTDYLSAKPVAKLRNVSTAHVKKLAKAGGLGELDTDTQWCDEGRTGGRTGTL
jgi:hypothetical protein